MEKNDKSTQKGNLLLVLVAMVLGVLVGLMFADTLHRRPSSSPLQGKMDEVMKLVESEYVDRVDVDSLSEDLVALMLSELDPHSTYLSTRETELNAEAMKGHFEGVGLVLRREGDTTYVLQISLDGPSEGVGIQPGDLILTVDGDTVVGLPSDTVVSRLRGPRGSTVEIGVVRHDRHGVPTTPLSFKVRRGVVRQLSLPYFDMLDDTTGYVMLSAFTATSHIEFQHALRELKARGMRHLIFDMRGNGGGALSSAVEIAGELLPMGSLIVYTQGAHSRRHNVRAHGGGLFATGRLTVMIDEASASATEVVSGALQDNDRAEIVGRRSFGKGLVQTEFSLKDGSSVHLTTARYYTPSGRCIQRPYDAGTDEYYREYMQQLIDETYADSAVAAVHDSTPYYTVGGRTVYGGGGIIPDRLLTYRRDPTFVYYNRLASEGLMHRVAFECVKRDAAALLQRFPDADAFCRGFQVDEATLQRVVTLGEQAGIARDRQSLQAQRRLITNRIKAYIGQSLYGDAVLYRIMLQEDEDLQKTRQL